MNVLLKNIPLIILLLLTSCVIEDGDSPGPADVFVKYYGDDGEHRVSKILVNSQGNIVIYGTQRKANETRRLYLLEIDSLGNQMGRVDTLDIKGLLNIISDEISVIASASDIYEIDDGYLIASTCNFTNGSSQSDAFIFWAHLGDDLELINGNSWDTISAPADPGGSPRGMFAEKIIQSEIDGNVIIAGSTFQAQPNDPYPSGQLQNLLIKEELTDDAATVWRRSDGRPNFSDQLISVTELESGELLCVGTTDRQGTEGEGGINVTFQQYNSQGLSQVDLALRVGMTIDQSSNVNDVPFSVIPFSGGVRVAGTSSLGNVSRAFIMTFQGTQVTRELISGENTAHSINGIGLTTTRDGDLILVGSNENVQNGDVYMVRTSSTGVKRSDFQEATFGIGSGSDIGKTAVTLPTGSILIGADIDFGSGQVMIGLMKINDRVELQRQ